VVLLNVWATWCGPLPDETPILQNIYRDLKDKGFVIMAIADEYSATVRSFADDYRITLGVFLDQSF
jgi:thiol-disulfide isomerase/thioredoxin